LLVVFLTETLYVVRDYGLLLEQNKAEIIVSLKKWRSNMQHNIEYIPPELCPILVQSGMTSNRLLLFLDDPKCNVASSIDNIKSLKELYYITENVTTNTLYSCQSYNTTKDHISLIAIQSFVN